MEYLCNERIVERQRAARCLGSKRVGRGFQGQAAVFSLPVLVLPSRGSEEVSDSETGSNAPSMRLRQLFDGIVLPPFQVLKWVEETVQAMKVHLLSSNHDGAQENKWEVPFDPSLREVTVSLSGPAPQIELSDPFGRHVYAAH